MFTVDQKILQSRKRHSFSYSKRKRYDEHKPQILAEPFCNRGIHSFHHYRPSRFFTGHDRRVTTDPGVDELSVRHCCGVAYRFQLEAVYLRRLKKQVKIVREEAHNLLA